MRFSEIPSELDIPIAYDRISDDIDDSNKAMQEHNNAVLQTAEETKKLNVNLLRLTEDLESERLERKEADRRNNRKANLAILIASVSAIATVLTFLFTFVVNG